MLITTMEIGTTYPITIANGNPYEDGKDQCSIWIDWNRDKDFDGVAETITVNGSPRHCEERSDAAISCPLPVRDALSF